MIFTELLVKLEGSTFNTEEIVVGSPLVFVKAVFSSLEQEVQLSNPKVIIANPNIENFKIFEFILLDLFFF